MSSVAELKIKTLDALSPGQQDTLIPGSIVQQITDVSGTKNITIHAEKKDGSNTYKTIANAADLTPGNQLNVVIQKANSSYVLVNAKKYTVTKDGDLAASIKGNKTYPRNPSHR